MKKQFLLTAFDPTEYIVGLAIVIGVFFLLREVMMWYWKVNTIVKNQETTITLQNRTNQLLKEHIELTRQQIGLVIGTDASSVEPNNPN